MAKGKHSTALFEVINRPARTGVAPPPVITRAPVNVPPPGGAKPAANPFAPEKSVELDSDRHQISLRVSYTVALITLFSVLVVVGLAYLVGRGVSTPDATASTDDVKNSTPNPAVMDVSGGSTPPANVPGSTPKPATPVAPMVTAGPIPAPANVKRIVGQNYVIMQSYPEEAQAKEAQALLLAAGIPCTVERGPSGWVPMSWFSVMGTHSFDRISKNPQLDAYVKAIENVNSSQKSKFKKLEPRAYKWK